jgi:hypothetical protein
VNRALIVGIVVAGLVLGWLWWNWRRASAGAEAELRRICFGDPGQLERLIAGEMRRAAPGTMSRAEAARRAVERHRRDNR